MGLHKIPYPRNGIISVLSSHLLPLRKWMNEFQKDIDDYTGAEPGLYALMYDIQQLREQLVQIELQYDTLKKKNKIFVRLPRGARMLTSPRANGVHLECDDADVAEEIISLLHDQMENTDLD